MSQNLYWRRVPVKSDPTLPTGLKWAFQKRYTSGVVFTSDDISWLKGVADATNDESVANACEKLIALLDAGTEIQLYVE